MSSILFERQEGVAVLTLNRPDKYNAFNREMALALQDCLDQCKRQAEVRAVLLTGAGKAFSAGQDLAEVVDPAGPTVSLRPVELGSYGENHVAVREGLRAGEWVVAGGWARTPACQWCLCRTRGLAWGRSRRASHW